MKKAAMFMNDKELALRKALDRNEKERDRSRKGFFINFLATIFFISFTLGLFPFLLEKIISKVKGISENPIRVNYLIGSIFFLGASNASLGLFWVAFRFRKGTGYRHQVHVLREELDKLEKEEKR